MGTSLQQNSVNYLVERGPAPKEYFTKVIKNISDCLWENNLNEKEKGIVSQKDNFTDLELICKDGVVRCHQAVLAHHSFFVRSVLLRNHVLEFGPNIDWGEASAYLCDRRKSENDCVLIVNDFECDTISRMLSCFYTGSINFESKKSGIKLKEAWDTFLIDSVQLADLTWVSKPQEKEFHETSEIDCTPPEPKRKTGKKRNRSPTIERESDSPIKKSNKNLPNEKCKDDNDSCSSHQDSPAESHETNKQSTENKWTSIKKMPSKVTEEKENCKEKNNAAQMTKNLQNHNSKEENDKTLSQSETLVDSNETENELIVNQWVSIRKIPSTVTEEKENNDGKSSDESKDLLLSSDNSSSSCEPNLIRKCEICHRKLVISSKPSKENLIEYQKHLLMHTNKALFGELPFLDKYYCPKSSNKKHERKILSFSNSETDKHVRCNSMFNDRESFVLHLSNQHDEFYPRLTRRLRETGGEGENSGSSEEYNQLKAIKRGLQNKITQTLFEFEIPRNSSFVQQICNEKDLLDVYEKEHMLGNPAQFLHCNICEKVFKNAENSLLHLFLEHVEIFRKKLRLISEQEDEVAFSDAIKMLGWKNDGNPTRLSYCCPFGSCVFETFCKGTFIRHIGFNHQLLKWMNWMNVEESLIENFNLTKMYIDFIELNPNCLESINTPKKQNTGNKTPKKQMSPGNSRNRSTDVIIEEMIDHSNLQENKLDGSFSVHNVLSLRNEVPITVPGQPSPNPSRKTPEKRNQNRSLEQHPRTSDNELFQCQECSRTQRTYSAKLRKPLMLQHLCASMHRNKPTTVVCLNCNEQFVCHTQNELIDHSCPLSSLLYKSINQSNSVARRRNISNNYSSNQNNDLGNNDVEECEVLNDVENIDSD